MPALSSTAWDDPVVTELTVAQQAELRLRDDGQGEPGVPPSVADVAVVLVPAARGRGTGYQPIGAYGHHLGADGDSLFSERTPA